MLEADIIDSNYIMFVLTRLLYIYIYIYLFIYLFILESIKDTFGM